MLAIEAVPAQAMHCGDRCEAAIEGRDLEDPGPVGEVSADRCRVGRQREPLSGIAPGGKIGPIRVSVAGARERRANSAAVQPLSAVEWPISGNEGIAVRINSFMACLPSCAVRGRFSTVRCRFVRPIDRFGGARGGFWASWTDPEVSLGLFPLFSQLPR